MPQPDARSSPHKRGWTVATAGVFAALAVVIFATFRDYGISWDEMLQNTYGEKLFSYYASGFTDRSAFSYVNLYLYGGLFDMLAAAANKISPFGVYETRHLLGGLGMLAGLFGAWRLADLLAGRRAAFLAVLCLATTPLLYGHGFINPKDSPFAWLCVWVAYYACRLLAAPEAMQPSALIGFGVTLGLALGSRVMAVAPLFYLALVLLLYVVLKPDRPRQIVRDSWRVAWPVAAVLPLAILVMAIFWPWSVQAPLNSIAAFETFSHFTWQPLVLWSGQLVPSDHLPPSYLTRLLVLQLPEYILLSLGIGLVLASRVLVNRGSIWARTAQARQMTFVVLCAAVPLIAFAVLRPVVYNGVRHFLFAVPPLVILAAVALDRVVGAAAAKNRLAGAAVASLIALAAGRECAILADLHPYEYVSYNAFIGGIRGAEKQFELDYWGTSLAAVSRDLAAYIAKAHAAGPVFICGDRMSAAYFLPPGIPITEQLEDADFYIAINDPPCRDHFGNPPAPVVAVQRDGVTLGYALDLRKPSAQSP